MKKPVKYSILGIVAVLVLLIAGRIIFAVWFMGQPKRIINSYVDGLQQTDSWSDEYTLVSCWTAINGYSFSFQTCNTDKLPKENFQEECGCYQWYREVGDSFYTISICPEDKSAHYSIYFHSLIDMIAE